VRKLLNNRIGRILDFKGSGNPFVSDILKFVGGTAFSQALAILASPVLTRLYCPEAFGLAALFASITGIIGVVACLRYDQSIMLPKEDEEAANLLGLSLLLAVLTGLITIFVIWLAKAPLLKLFNATALGKYLWLAPLAVFLIGSFASLNCWNSRRKRFGRLSISRVNGSICSVGAQIVAGLTEYSTGGSLIGGAIFGSAVSSFVLGWQIWIDDHKIFKNIKFQKIKSGLLRYKRFPKYDTLSALLNSISLQLPVFFLNIFFSPVSAGYYAISNCLVFMPVIFISTAICQVFFQRSSRAKYEGNLSSISEIILIKLIEIGLYPFLLLSFIGKELFIFAFGLPWAEAGIYAEILSLFGFFVFVTSPMCVLLIVLEKQNILLDFNIFFISIRFISLYTGGLLGNARLSLMLFSISGAVINLILLLYILNMLKISLQIIFKELMPYLIYSILALSILLYCKLIIIGFITIIIYYILLFYINIYSKDIILK